MFRHILYHSLWCSALFCATVSQQPPRPATKLEQELAQFSTYHKSNKYGEVKQILNKLHRENGAPDASMRSGIGAGESRTVVVQDDTEISKNSAVFDELFEGDIVLTVEQAKQVLEANSKSSSMPERRHKRKVMRDSNSRWPSNTVYYTFDRRLSDYKTGVIKQAIKIWEDNTCVHFREGTGNGDFVTFYSGSGCFSSIGREGGQQVLSIGDGCESVGIASHEIGHSLGFWHEQSRFDRDTFISVQMQNIISGTQGNFARASNRIMTDFGVPYDLGSVMHYGSKAFSYDQNQYTIRTLDSNYQTTIGQRQSLSFIDIKQVNMAYCSGVCRNQLACQHDGYPDPSGGGTRCGQCRCPSGFSGTYCETVASSNENCGGVLTATNDWQTIRTPSSTQSRPCNWILKAPSSGHVILEILHVNLQCRDTCNRYIEIKKGPSFSQTGYRFCCVNSWQNPITSVGNEMAVIYNAAAANDFSTGASFRFRTDAPPSSNRPTSSGSSSGGTGGSGSYWGPWSGWSHCSASCGGCGVKTRQRSCIGGSCSNGSPTERETCGESLCAQGVSTKIDSLCRYQTKVSCANVRRFHQWHSREMRGPTHANDSPHPSVVAADAAPNQALPGGSAANTLHPPTNDLPPDFDIAPDNLQTDIKFEGPKNAAPAAGRRRQRRQQDDQDCSATVWYMCAKSSPYFYRSLTAEEMNNRVISSGWNKSRSSQLAQCCNGFEPSGNVCTRRRR